MKGSHPKPADRCAFVLRHSISQVTSFMQSGMLWKHFPRSSPFVRGINRSLVNSSHKGQWHGALMFSLICSWINGWVNNREAGVLRRHRTLYDVTIMMTPILSGCFCDTDANSSYFRRQWSDYLKHKWNWPETLDKNKWCGTQDSLFNIQYVARHRGSKNWLLF